MIKIRKITPLLFILVLTLMFCFSTTAFAVSEENNPGSSDDPELTEYLVSFYDDSTEYEDYRTNVTSGTTVSKPETDPVKEGYDFKGWYEDNLFSTEFDFSSPITSDTQIYAKFELKSSEPSSETQTLPVYFFFEETKVFETTVNINTGYLTDTSVPSSYEDTDITGWANEVYTLTDGVITNTELERISFGEDESITFSAEFEDFDYTVTFYDADGTTVLYTQKVKENDIPSVDGISACTGVTNWLNSNNSFVILSTQKITQDTSYKAYYAPSLSSSATYIKGADSNGLLFKPNNSITRAEAATIIYRLLEDKSLGSFNCSFSDVSSTDWYYEAVTCLASKNILNGTGGGKFSPNNYIKRQDFVLILSRLFSMEEYTGEDAFTDIKLDDIGSMYYNAIMNAYSKGWVNGVSAGVFSPSSYVSRAQAVVIVNRVLGRANTIGSFTENRDARIFIDVDDESQWYFDAVMDATYSTENLIKSSIDEGLHQTNGIRYYINEDHKLEYLEKGINNVAGYYFYISRNGCNINKFSSGAQLMSDGKYYLILDNGTVAYEKPSNYITSVYPYGDSIYYIKADHSVAHNESVGNLYFNNYCKYTTTNATLDAYLNNYLKSVYATGGTQEQMLRSVYLKMRDDSGFTYINRNGTTKYEHAMQLLTKKYGNCLCWANTAVFLFQRLGFDAETLYGSVTGWVSGRETAHQWEVINWPDSRGDASSTKYMFDIQLEWSYWGPNGIWGHCNYNCYKMYYSTNQTAAYYSW